MSVQVQFLNERHIFPDQLSIDIMSSGMGLQIKGRANATASDPGYAFTGSNKGGLDDTSRTGVRREDDR